MAITPFSGWFTYLYYMFQTDLPAGFYCNVISGYKDSTRDKCESHSVVEVDKKGVVVIDMLKSHLKEMVVIHTLVSVTE